MNVGDYSPGWCPLKSRRCDNDCPWWSTERNRCAVLDISASLWRLSTAIAALAKSTTRDDGMDAGE